ncbi:MAG TPA: hypothetical protein VJ732_05595 [Bryobacteraceae bacterium]|nr:hypothetical protein [Bryobacteraceae bacterium]
MSPNGVPGMARLARRGGADPLKKSYQEQRNDNFLFHAQRIFLPPWRRPAVLFQLPEEILYPARHGIPEQFTQYSAFLFTGERKSKRRR